MSSQRPVVLVTGASTGIGQAISYAFSRAGYPVAVNDKHVDGDCQTVSKIRSEGGHASAFAADVGDPVAVDSMFNRVRDQLGPVGVVVNNAALYDTYDPSDISPADTIQMLTVDIAGPLFTTQSAMTHMESLGGGVIINISSLNGYVTIPQNTVYAAAKAGLIGLNRGLALALAPKGVRVVSISPGFIETQAVSHYLASLTQERRVSELGDHNSRIALGRLGLPREIADVAVFLASKDASVITGVDFLVDGGTHAYNTVFTYTP